VATLFLPSLVVLEFSSVQLKFQELHLIVVHEKVIDSRWAFIALF